MALFPASGGSSELVGVDTANVVHSFSSGSDSWTATEDCYVVGFLYYTSAMGNNGAYVSIDGKYASGIFAGFTPAQSFSVQYACACCVPVKKGQTVALNTNSSDYNAVKCYKVKK